MADIERQYEYKPRWSHVLLVGGFCTLLAASAIARASPENLGVLYWIVLVVSLAGVPLGFRHRASGGSGKAAPLLALPPPRTVRAPFDAYGSSIGQRT